MSPHSVPQPDSVSSDLNKPDFNKPELAKLSLPLLLEAEQLLPLLDHPLLRIVDLGKARVYEQVHLPNAIWLSPSALVRQEENASGLLPDTAQLQQLVQTLGITQRQHIVVYDDEGGAWAGRLIWTLHMMGFDQVSLLNGGIHYWLAKGFPTSNEPVTAPHVSQTAFVLTPKHQIVFDQLRQIVLEQPSSHSFWDCRTFEEYTGSRLAARRGGHLPSAMHLEWDSLFDRQDHVRLKPLPMIHHLLAARGLDFTKPLVVYCQSHHRSGLAYVVARLFNLQVRAYDGAWSEWGNRLDTPIATGENPR